MNQLPARHVMKKYRMEDLTGAHHGGDELLYIGMMILINLTNREV
jgi:hypothetical protein